MPSLRHVARAEISRERIGPYTLVAKFGGGSFGQVAERTHHGANAENGL